MTFCCLQLIDCAGNGNSGCEGGDTCSLLEWLVDKKINIELDNKYPLAWRTQTCKLKGYVLCGIYVYFYTLLLRMFDLTVKWLPCIQEVLVSAKYSLWMSPPK